MNRRRLPGLLFALLLAARCPGAAAAAESPELTTDERERVSALKIRGDHVSLVEYLESRIGRDEPTMLQLHELCTATLSASQFGKMTSCFARLERKSSGAPIMVGSMDYTSFAYGIMASGYSVIGAYEQSISAAKRAIASIAPNDRSRALMLRHPLSVLGYSQAMSGHQEEARETAKELEATTYAPPAILGLSEKQIRGMNSSKYHGLLRLYLALGDFEQALLQSDGTEPIWSPESDELMAKKMGSAVWAESKSYQSMLWRMTRGRILLELGRLAEARQNLDDSLADPRASRLGELMGHALYDRGRIAEQEGKPAEAIEYFRRAVDRIESLRSSIDTEAAKIGFVGNKQDIYARLIKALVAANRPGEAFEYAERAKARALVDLLAGREKFERQGGEAGTEARALLPALNRLHGELARFDAATATPEQAEKILQTRALVRKTSEDLAKADSELASLVTVTGFTEARLRALLQPDETLAEYYYLGNDLYAFVVTRSELRAVRLEGAGLADAVRRFRAAVQNPNAKDTAKLSGELHSRLIAPLGLPPQGKLLIVPHGELHYLPFNALGNGKDLVIDRYTLRLLPSASVMGFLNRRQASGKGTIVFGNPDLGDPGYDLPGAQKEALEIGRIDPGATVLLRAEASKTAARSLAGGFARVHFASHGKFDPLKPLQSGIYLAKGTDDNGTLTVDELYSLKLNADLVTLSACETALGSINNGDDVVGLTRGLFYAGAASIVSSLWEVDDQATYQIMTRFYSDLNKVPKAEALRNAQLALKAKSPHPYYWAAFQLTGNRQ